MYKFISVETEGGVTTVTLNRPEVMNAIHIEMHLELQDAFDRFADNPKQVVCIVTGAGAKAFCAGSDLKSAVAAGGHPEYPKSGYAGLIKRFDCPKPFIAAVNGLALGGGFEIALACDLIIASKNASFGLPEPLVGAVALGGGLHRLPRQIGLKPALGMILTSKRIDAEEAFRLGLVNEVARQSSLMDVAARWADEILRGSPMSIFASKETVHRGLDEATLSDALENQENYSAFSAWRMSDDAIEGPRAFAEKRKPVWKGR